MKLTVRPDHEVARAMGSFDGRARPRICMLLESYFPVVGGMETGARSLAAALHRRGIRVTIVTRRTDRSLPRSDTHDGVVVYRTSPTGRSSRYRWLQMFSCVPTLLRLRDSYDVILVLGFRVLGVPATLVAHRLGKLCVLRAESRGEFSGDFFSGGLSRLSLSPSSPGVRKILDLRNRLLATNAAFVSMSSELTEEFLMCGAHRDRIHWIPQGVDTQRLRPVDSRTKHFLRSKLGLPSGHMLVTFTGRLVAYKGLPELVDAWRDLADRFPRATLVLVGSGGTDIYSCERWIEQAAQEKDLRGRVILPGAVENVEEYLQASDIFVFPSRNEAFGISLIEAFACGLPAVTTSNGGIRDIVTAGRDALVVPVDSPDDLREALAHLLEDPVKCKTLGRAAAYKVKQSYTLDRVADAFERLLTSLTPGVIDARSLTSIAGKKTFEDRGPKDVKRP